MGLGENTVCQTFPQMIHESSSVHIPSLYTATPQQSWNYVVSVRLKITTAKAYPLRFLYLAHRHGRIVGSKSHHDYRMVVAPVGKPSTTYDNLYIRPRMWIVLDDVRERNAYGRVYYGL